METTLTRAELAGERSADSGSGEVSIARQGASLSVPPSSPEDAGRWERECRALLALIGEAATRRRYERGEIIYEKGEPCDALYVLARGMVKLSKPYYSGSKEAILRLLGPWDVLSPPAFGGEAVRQTRAEAVTVCEVVKVPRVFVERTLRRHPQAALSLMTLLGLELFRRDEWAGCLLPYKAEAKLANLLLILAGRFGRRTDAGTTVLPRLTHEELASMIAASRESVTHALGDLRRRGVLGREREQVVILKDKELAEAGRRMPLRAKER
jgi:CRP-like cAMP-binding protein